MKNYRYQYTIFLFLFAGLMISHLLSAQKPNFKFKSINQADGLINSTVQTIFEDSYGFIWIGTHQGVQRYEGKAFKNYVHNGNDSIGLSSNYINGFCEDSERNIWIATAFGLNKYNRSIDKIEKYQWKDKSFTENGDLFIYGLAMDNSNKHHIWITASDIGLIKLDIENDSVVVYPMQASGKRWSSWIIPYPGQSNRLLLGGIGLYVFDKISGQFNELLSLEQNADVPNHLINDADFDPENSDIIWLATGDYWGRGNLGGLIRFNLKTGEKIIFSPETRKNEVPDRHMLNLCFYDAENLWIGTRHNGALLYKIREDRFYNFINNEFDEGSFTTEDAVRSMLVDRSGTLWFGTWGDGISLLSPAAQKFLHYKYLPGETNGLQNNYITSFAEDKKGNIWIGTKTGGLSKFDPIEKTFENYFQEFASPDPNSTEITYLFYDSNENLWIGTYDDALYRFNPATGFKVHYQKGSSKNNVSQKRISAITEIKPGEILISTYGGGLNIYNYQTDFFRHFIHHPDDSTSIPDNQIWLPFLGDDGNYYFSGNSAAGLIQFNPETEKFQEIHPKKSISTFMMPGKTSDGRVFVNEVTEGLREIITTDVITVNTVYDSNGNLLKNIETILVDANDKLWLGTGNGLLEFDLNNKTVIRYDANDGLQGYEFNRFAAYKSASGEMYFGGTKGFNMFHPDVMKLSTYEPPIVFTDFKLFQESMSIDDDSPLKQNILMTDKLALNYDQNDFSISFAALDFSNPQKIEYKYMLENHDEEWIMVGNNNIASYTNMDPGHYTFRVLATNGDGQWNQQSAKLEITITPPWWQTNLAYLLYGLIFITGVILVDRVQRKRLKEKEQAQARETELAQAKEIEKAYNKLKTTQSQLIQAEKMASLGELTAGIAHEIQNPLNFINNFSEINQELILEMKAEIQKSNFEEVNAIANDISGNEEKILQHGKRADAIVKGMLQHSKTSTGHKEPIDINALADEYLRLAYHGLRAKDKSFNATMKTDFDASIGKINVVPQDIGRVILNLITNAFYAVNEKEKQNINGYEPAVSLSTKKLEGQVEIKVADNGNGIPQKILDKIFQPFFTTKPTGQGTGLGLSLSYDIVKALGGEIKVNSSREYGTEFIVLLKL